MINEIILSLEKNVFGGFGIHVFLFLLLRLFRINHRSLVDWDDAALHVVRWGGLMYAVFCVASYAQTTVDVRYSFAFWFQPGIWAMATQLLWFTPFRKNGFLRVLPALLLLLRFESLVIFCTALHREYLPPVWDTGNLLHIGRMLLGEWGLFSGLVLGFFFWHRNRNRHALR